MFASPRSLPSDQAAFSQRKWRFACRSGCASEYQGDAEHQCSLSELNVQLAASNRGWRPAQATAATATATNYQRLPPTTMRALQRPLVEMINSLGEGERKSLAFKQ
jgi:hypothetical protein